MVYLSPLPLLVARVAADDQKLAVPSHELAVFTYPLDTRTDFHGSIPSPTAFFGSYFFSSAVEP
jgi:hypothetical protein